MTNDVGADLQGGLEKHILFLSIKGVGGLMSYMLCNSVAPLKSSRDK